MANVWMTANVRLHSGFMYREPPSWTDQRPVHMNGRDRRARPLTGTMDRQTVKLPQRSVSEITRQCSCPEIRPRQMQALLCQFASGTRATGHCLVISLIWWWGNVCPSNVHVNGYDRRSRSLNWQALRMHASTLTICCLQTSWKLLETPQPVSRYISTTVFGDMFVTVLDNMLAISNNLVRLSTPALCRREDHVGPYISTTLPCPHYGCQHIA